MLCGNVGLRGGGLNPLCLQSNAQGACDMGVLPDVYSDYQKVADQAVVDRMAKFWSMENLPQHPGFTATEMMDKAQRGEMKALYVIGQNPVVSEIDFDYEQKCLEKLDFLVVQDIVMTETAKMANVILPSTSFAEKDGTFTNTERRVQRVRKAVVPPGEAREDREIICDLANRMGYSMAYENSQAVMEEITKVTPSYGGINYERINNEGLYSPCTGVDHPGTSRLHKEKFACGRGVFHAII
jgi:predicted molibdopterin-dependent oxidoreductase YjgC